MSGVSQKGRKYKFLIRSKLFVPTQKKGSRKVLSLLFNSEQIANPRSKRYNALVNEPFRDAFEQTACNRKLWTFSMCFIGLSGVQIHVSPWFWCAHACKHRLTVLFEFPLSFRTFRPFCFPLWA